MKPHLISFRIALKLFIIVLTSGMMVTSCSNDFLEMQYPSVNIEGDTLFVLSQADNFSYDLDMKNRETVSWKLLQYPRWMDINPKEGIADADAPVKLYFTINEHELFFGLGLYSFPLIFDVEKMGLVQHTIVIFNAGQPDISTTQTVIEADYTLEGIYQINNSGYGILMWEVVSQPDWLTLQSDNGVLNEYQYSAWHYSIDPTGLEAGEHSGTVEIKSNASATSFFIEFRFTVDEKRYYGDYITGDFMDAAYISHLNRVVVLTKNPGQLLFFRTDSPKADTISLNRVPQCMALSEDGTALAVGFSNAEISTFRTPSGEVLATHSAGQVPAQIEFGGANRLFFLGEKNYSYTINGMDVQTGEIYQSKNTLSGLTDLKKVPGKELLLSTRKGYSPDDLFVIDISNGLVTDSINEYWMTLAGLWLSADGEKFFTGNRQIYQVPEYIPGQSMSMQLPPLLGDLGFTNGERIQSIAHHQASEKIFIGYETGWFSNRSYIKSLDYNTLSEQRSWELISNPPYGYPPGNSWWSEILQLFPSASGDEIWVIRKYPAATYGSPETWSIERLDN